MMKEAMYYQQIENSKVKCLLCPTECVIAPGNMGSCRSRKNIEGKLIAINYGKSTSLNLDPIEKKPLYHFYPGETILSLGPNSCNLHCQFCQNYYISQYNANTYDISPEKLHNIIRDNDYKVVSYTYTEPLTWYEYIYDCGKLFHEDARFVLVTNGYINQEPLIQLMLYVDAMNIDLKSIKDFFYRQICGGKLAPVKETIEYAAQHCHLEVTNLLIPGCNDSEEELEELVSYLASVNPEIPLHFSRYFPHWKFDREPTPVSTLERAYKIAKSKLKYVYLGNLGWSKYSSTICPSCEKIVISRDGFLVQNKIAEDNHCPYCSYLIYGQFQ